MQVVRRKMHKPVVIFIFLLIVTVGLSIPTPYLNDIPLEIPIEYALKDLNSFGLHLPNTTPICVVDVNGNLRYTFGKRIKYDRLVSQNSDKSFWSSPKNVTLILQYPINGQGAIITFVEVIVNQSSNIGAARVIAGGIGKRFIATIIEGNRTYWFNYSANIYGI